FSAFYCNKTTLHFLFSLCRLFLCRLSFGSPNAAKETNDAVYEKVLFLCCKIKICSLAIAYSYRMKGIRSHKKNIHVSIVSWFSTIFKCSLYFTFIDESTVCIVI